MVACVRPFDCQGLSLWPEERTESEMRCRFVVDETHPWVLGHFPGNPVLPAFAQLVLVRSAVEAFLGCKVEMSRVTKTRFQSVIPPGAAASLVVEKCENPAEMRWRIEMGANLCSQGVFHFQMGSSRTTRFVS